MKRFLILTLGAIAVAALALTPALAGTGGATKWRITITNLTPAGPGAPGSQPLSPPLLAVHNSNADVWSVGDAASHVVAAIAEDANTAPAEELLKKVKGVRSVKTGKGGPIASGASASYTVRTKGNQNRLSIVSMLVNTNDAFTGLDSVVLKDGMVVMVNAYDAGTEKNTQAKSDIPGPCCGNAFVRAPEGKLIRKHPGIKARGALTKASYGWSGPVAMITVEKA